MSYVNHTVPLIENPEGIDEAIQSIQLELGELDWLEKVYGRAWEHKEPDTSKELFVRVPKVYLGNGEYVNVLPNDHFTSMCFFAVRDSEKWAEPFSRFDRNAKERSASVIFWFNLKRIDRTKDYIFTEELKNDVERILKQNPFVKKIVQYYDERVEHVFDGLVNEAKYARYTVQDVQTQFLMHPYSGFRFDILLSYLEKC